MSSEPATSKTCQECGGEYYCKGRCKQHYNAYYRSINPTYFQEKRREYRKENPEYFKDKYLSRSEDQKNKYREHYRTRNKKSYLQRTYGLTDERLCQMLKEQEGKCRICGTKESGRTQRGRLYVDHCHTTGKVRGLLCHQCNAGLGMFKDNAASLEAAIKYLKETS